MSALRDAALAYATAAMPVLPLDGKVPRIQGGLTNASADVLKVAEWWSRWPDANIGVVTGPASGYVVLDVDGPAGVRSLAELERRHGAIQTARVLTGSGGFHLWFRCPDEPIRNSAGAFGEGLDVRGEGGYVVVPPSIHGTGNPYRWTRELEHVTECPAWLLEDTRTRRNGSAPAVGDVIPEGERDGTLASLAGSMRRRGMGQVEILAALRVTNAERCRPPLRESDLERIARSVARYQPATVTAHVATGPVPLETAQAVGRSELDRDALRDDIGNAERFAADHAGRLRHVAAFSPPWLVWDGRRWAPDETGEHVEAAKQTADRLFREAGERDEDWKKYAAGTRRASRLRSMIDLARSDARLARRAGDFDVDPWVLNTTSGTVDLRTGELRPHDPADALTKLAGAAFRPDAEAPTWQAFLGRILAGDSDLEAFLRRLAGYSAIGAVREHVLAILWGSGANGKSVLANALRFALGDYAYEGTVELLLGRQRTGGATPEAADLRGRRLVAIRETREDGKLAAERVKVLTGGDPVTARHLYGQPFTFTPSHTTWLLTNHRPRVDDDGDAIWRRLCLVSITVTIPPEEQNAELGARLELEADGILAWIVQGAREYLAEGLNPPEAVRVATDEYRSAEDAFSAWLDECCELDRAAFTPTARLRESYSEWAKRNGSEELTSNALAERLTRRVLPGLTAQRTKRVRGWKGLRLLEGREG